MLRVIAQFYQNSINHINTRWAWFFTNGMKEPFQES
jgi:hypothetical protein